MKMEVAPSPQFKFHQWELSHMVTASSKVGLENVVSSWVALGPGRREQFSGNNLSTKMIISGPCKTPRLFHPFIYSLFFMAIPHTHPIYLGNQSIVFKVHTSCDFSGGPVVKNSPSNAGDVDSIPGQGTKSPHARGQVCHIPHATTREFVSWNYRGHTC